MHDRFGFPALFDTDNAGPTRHQAHLTMGDLMPAGAGAFVPRAVKFLAETASLDAAFERPNASTRITKTTSSPPSRRRFFALGAASDETFSTPRSGPFVPMKTVGNGADRWIPEAKTTTQTRTASYVSIIEVALESMRA